MQELPPCPEGPLLALALGAAPLRPHRDFEGLVQGGGGACCTLYAVGMLGVVGWHVCLKWPCGLSVHMGICCGGKWFPQGKRMCHTRPPHMWVLRAGVSQSLTDIIQT